MLLAWHICWVEVEVASWQVVEAHAHIAWTQHGYTSKSWVMQFHPYGSTNQYVPPSVWPKSHVLEIDAYYIQSWGGSGIMTSCWGSWTHCMDPTWVYKQELGDAIPSIRLNTLNYVLHGLAKITRAGNWCCQHAIYMQSWGGSGIMTSCWGLCTHCMDSTWIHKQELGGAIPSLRLNTPTIFASHGLSKITRAGNWCCQHDIYAELRWRRGIMTSCWGSCTPRMDPTGIYRQDLVGAIPSL